MSSRWVYPVIILFLAIGLLVGSLIFINPPGRSAQTGSTDPQTGLIHTYSSKRGVTKFTRPGANTFYRLIGRFPERLTIAGDALAGKFVIDEDPNQAPITVSLDATGGTAAFILFPNSLEDEHEATQVSSEMIRDLVAADTPVAIFVGATESEPLVEALEKALTDQWQIPQGQSVSLLVIGVVKKEQSP
jgi:hypothetical protein